MNPTGYIRTDFVSLLGKIDCVSKRAGECLYNLGVGDEFSSVLVF